MDHVTARTQRARGHLLVDRELAAELGRAIRPAPGAPPPAPAQVQPASIDLRVGPVAWRIRAGFLPGRAPIESRLQDLAIAAHSLSGEGAILERGLLYLVPLDEELALPPDVRARFNPRSSTGRCDIFTRVLCDGHARFDETPAGYAGRLWLEVAPLSFPVRVRRGDRLCQMRLVRGDAALSATELEELWNDTPLAFEGARALSRSEVELDGAGGLLLRVGLKGRDPAGWRAAAHTDVVEFGRAGAHDPRDYFEPVHAPDGRAILRPESFFVFASRERIRIPPQVAAEMQPVDLGLGELRSNYAGFFDSGFGWREDASGPVPGGTPAVLEVRAHDVPFLIEDGQTFCRLRFFRTSSRPDRLYGEGRGVSYHDQDLTLARCFKETHGDAAG